MTAFTGTYSVSATPRTKEQWDHWFDVTAPVIREEERSFGRTGLPAREPPGYCPGCGARVKNDPCTAWYYCPECDATWEEHELLAEMPAEKEATHNG